MAQFKIQITKMESVEKKGSNYEKVADSGNKMDNGAVYDYIPVIKSVTEEQNIFQCVVKDLNVDAVIKSIYKL